MCPGENVLWRLDKDGDWVSSPGGAGAEAGVPTQEVVPTYHLTIINPSSNPLRRLNCQFSFVLHFGRVSASIALRAWSNIYSSPVDFPVQFHTIPKPISFGGCSDSWDLVYFATILVLFESNLHTPHYLLQHNNCYIILNF